jgi:hypothetical protein
MRRMPARRIIVLVVRLNDDRENDDYDGRR